MSSTNESSQIARRFLAVRIGVGLSQQAFADALGISLRGEQNYERGIRRLPAEVVLSLAKVFGIDPLWVLDGPEDQPRRLDYNGGLDQDLLARAMKVVMAAVKDSGKKISGDQIADWVAAVYRFYSENTSGTGAEALVKTLIGAKR